MNRLILCVLLVAAVYAMDLASANPWDLAFGTLAAVVVLLGGRAFLFGGMPRSVPGLARRIVAFGPFMWAAWREILKGTWVVLLTTLHIRPLCCPGFVRVPFDERSEVGVTVMAFISSLSPGEYTVDFDPEKREIIVHVIDASDPEAIRRNHRRLYERYQRAVAP